MMLVVLKLGTLKRSCRNYEISSKNTFVFLTIWVQVTSIHISCRNSSGKVHFDGPKCRQRNSNNALNVCGILTS